VAGDEVGAGAVAVAVRAVLVASRRSLRSPSQRRTPLRTLLQRLRKMMTLSWSSQMRRTQKRTREPPKGELSALLPMAF
jgi:hypothetical protein